MEDARRSSRGPVGSVLVLALAAASCGGSGGGGGPGATGAAFSSTPAPGAVDVEPDVVVRVQLSLPSGPVQATWLKLECDGEPVAGSLTRIADTLVFEPDSRLRLLGEHTVTLAVPAAAGATFGFSVRDGIWSAPTPVADDVRVVALAGDADRGAWVCMLTPAAPLSRMALAYVDRAGVVGPWSWLVNDATVEHATLAVDADGLALVAAARRASDGAYRVWTSVRSAGANAWGPFLPVSGTSTVPPVPHACFARAGAAVVAWEVPNTRDLWRVTFDAGDGWSEPEPLEPPDTAAEALELASDGAGSVVAAWRTLPGERLESCVFDPDGSERALRIFEPSGCCIGEPRVAAAGGRALAVWRADDGLLASWLTGEEWSVAVPVALGESGSFEGPIRVALSEAGIGQVAWIAGGTLRGRRVEAGGVMGPTTELSTPGGSPASPVLALDVPGNALCVWDELSTEWPGKGIRVARTLVSGGWGLGEALQFVEGDCSVAPRLAGTQGGAAWVAWTSTVGCDFTLGFGVSLARFD